MKWPCQEKKKGILPCTGSMVQNRELGLLSFGNYKFPKLWKAKFPRYFGSLESILTTGVVVVLCVWVGETNEQR